MKPLLIAQVLAQMSPSQSVPPTSVTLVLSSLTNIYLVFFPFPSTRRCGTLLPPGESKLCVPRTWDPAWHRGSGGLGFGEALCLHVGTQLSSL